MAATLRALLLLDTPSERLVFRAHHTDEGVLLACDEEELEELLGYTTSKA